VLDHCGVIGIFSLQGNNVAPMIIAGLESMQHRGQESWGIVVSNNNPYKKMGIVSMMDDIAFRKVTNMNGNVGVGHVRYSTSSTSDLENAHPLKIDGSKKFYICHNGTLEKEALLRCLNKTGFSDKMTDTFLLGLGLHRNLKRGFEWVDGFKKLNPYLNGSFSITILTEKGELIVARDDRGFRPLCMGWHKETASYIFASESCVLNSLGAELIRDVKPGEIIKTNKNGLMEQRFAELDKHSHCALEYTYFAHPASCIDKVNVYEARKKIGAKLAEKYPVEGDVVIPVPDSSRPAALGYSERSGIPFEEGLMKDRYIMKGTWRSFIEPKNRKQVIRNITSIQHVVDGKRIILVDDSIVRGTSSKIIIKEKLRDAKEVNFFLTFPPIRYPCFMGIDFPTQKELLAYRICKNCKKIDEINKRMALELGVEFLGYNNIEGLMKGINKTEDQLCLACTSGDYSCLKQKPKLY
jgi:amidophosphoribosyltransferase